MSNWKDEQRKQEEKDRESRAAEVKARKEREKQIIEYTRRIENNPEALRVLYGFEDERLWGEIMGRSELPRPFLRFYDAGWDGSKPPPDEIQTRRFYKEKIFPSGVYIGFFCQIDNPYFRIKTHRFDLVTVFQQEDRRLESSFQATIDINHASLSWYNCLLPKGGWGEFQWEVYAFADNKLVATESFFVR